MTTNKESGLELKVGLFICVGLLVIAAMIVEFGLGGSQGFKKYYALTLDLPNANGLLKGSDVLLAGARVGYVGTKPLLSSNLGSVRVTVEIDEKIKIPKDSMFKVDSSGLLGDKFVAIQTPPDFKPDKFDPNDPKQAYQPGDNIVGQHAGDLMEQVTPALKKLSDELDKLQDATVKLTEGLLSDANLASVHDTLVNLKTTSTNFADASKGFNGIVQSTQETVDKAKETMTTADAAAGDLRKTLEAARIVIQKATQGDGLVAALLSNRELADNFKALVINLREHGVLFYRNSPVKEQTPAAPAGGRSRKR